MAGLGGVYDGVRRDISELVSSLDERDVSKPVPATSDWTIKDLVAHLAGVAEGALAGNFPREFFESWGEPEGVRKLNSWTSAQVTDRKEESLETILEEWEKHATALVPMLDGGATVPPEFPPFADRVMVTDVGVHEQDIYGALGLERHRDAAPVKVGSSSYAAMMDIHIRKAGASPLLLDAGEKKWVVGGDEPDGSVRTTRFEFFRALSGRRSPDQIRAYEWSGDPGPFIDFFYPYGVRADALVE
jgi:uncharacterized protein (TIGR03083 family)